jgi:hypothetical protein
MRGIDPSLVDLVWREITAYAPARVEREAARFIDQQPHAAAFVRSMTAGQDPAVQQAALGLAFLVFEIVARSAGRPVPRVAEERLAGAWEETRAWLAHDGSADPARVLERAADPTHPTLVTYLLSVFYGDAEPAHYDEGIRASLLLVLRTLATALDLGAVEA